MSRKNNHYSAELKYQPVAEYLSGGGSLWEIIQKYGILPDRQLRNWIKMNNSHTELKSYTGGSRIRDRNDNKLVFDKVVQETPDAYPLFHSDRGYQYTSRAFHKKTAGC